MKIDQPQVLALAFLQDDHPVVELHRHFNHVSFTIQATLGLPRRKSIKTEYFYVSFYDDQNFLFAQDYFSMTIPLESEFGEMDSEFDLVLPSKIFNTMTIVFASTTLPPETTHLSTILDQSAFFSTQIRLKEESPHG